MGTRRARKYTFAAPMSLHFHVPGDQEHIEIFCHKVPVHLHLGGEVRDCHPSLVPFENSFYFIDFF